jgi:hypothetical protein
MDISYEGMSAREAVMIVSAHKSIKNPTGLRIGYLWGEYIASRNLSDTDRAAVDAFVDFVIAEMRK